MQIVNNGPWFCPINGLEIRKTFFEELECFIIFHIADMLAWNGEFSLVSVKVFFRSAPQPSTSGPSLTERDRSRRVAPGTTDETQC